MKENIHLQVVPNIRIYDMGIALSGAERWYARFLSGVKLIPDVTVTLRHRISCSSLMPLI